MGVSVHVRDFVDLYKVSIESSIILIRLLAS
jgi:hypothetical protein